MEELMLASMALGLVEKLIPMIEARVKAGQVSVTEQAALKARINAIRDGTAFLGDEWKPDPS